MDYEPQANETACQVAQALRAGSPKTTGYSLMPFSGSLGPGLLGVTCPNVSETGTPPSDDSIVGPPRVSGSWSSTSCKTPTWSR